MKKFSFKNLVLFIIAAVFCAGLFLGSNLSAGAAVYASTPINHENAHENQTQNILITSIVDGGNSSKTIYLYPHSSNGASSINEFFTFYSTKGANKGLDKSNPNELVYDMSYDGGGPSSALPYNGEFSSLIEISKNLQIALKQGYVEISSSAKTTSKAYKSDNADKVTSSLYVFDSNAGSHKKDETYIIKDSTSTRNDTLEVDAFTFASSELEGFSFDTIEINFKSTLVNKIMFTNHNYMKIVEPKVEISTSDVTVPTLELEYSINWAQSRTVTINALDTESGLQKVEYKLGNGEWIELASYEDYKTEDVLSVEMTENTKLTVRTTDNVGNVSETYYNEENIDTIAPSLSIEINRAETDMSFDFASNFASNHTEFVSPEKYYYTFNINGGAESSKINLLNGLNHFDGTEVGIYNFTFYAEDEAGNSSEPFSITLVFKKLLEISSVTENYVYAGEVINLDYSSITYSGSLVSEDELSLAGFGLNITQNGENATLKNAGTYSYEFVCTNEYYVINKKGNITISPYEIVLTIVCDKFEYSSYAIFLDYTLDREVSVLVTYTDSHGNIVLEPRAVGSYTANIKYVEDSNYILNETLPLVITKRTLVVTAENKTITYGDAIPELTYEIVGALDGDNLNFDIICDYTVNAGEYAISFKQKTELIKAEELMLENYDYSFVDAVLTIAKKIATITPDENQSKLYKTEEPVITYTVSGLIGSDTLSGALSRAEGENAGSYQIEIGTLSSNNYDLKLYPSSFQITKRIAYIIINSASKVYGDANPEFTFKTDDSNVLDEDVALIQNAIYFDGTENVGTYKLTLDKSVSGNYVFVVLDSKFTVTKRPLNVVANQIIAEYGEEKALTYSSDNLVNGDVLSGSLERVSGNEIGKYDILLGTLGSSNYEITFTSAEYEIVKKLVTVTANNITKIYGDAENLEFSVSGTDKLLNISLVREAGENVGTYQISGYVFDDEKHYDINFVPATLTIVPQKISIEIFDASKVYGNADPEFKYLVSGAEGLKLNFVREAGENVGSYKISLGENNFSNYEIENVSFASLVIEKADIDLPNFGDEIHVTYSGGANYIHLEESEFAITLTYKLFGTEKEPVDAGRYEVYASFAGDENHNSVESKFVTTLIVGKKFVPIILKKSAFNYTGEGFLPEYDVVTDENVNLVVSFEEGISIPTEIGEYDFVIVSNDPNYVCDFKGTLTIFEGFISNAGGAQAVADGVGLSKYGIKLFEDTTSSLRSIFNPLTDGRKCISVYSFKNAENYTSGDVFTVSIKAVDNDDVKIYAVDKDGKMVAVSYTVVGGCYVVSVNDISASIVVTVADSTFVYAKIISVFAILVLCYVITKTVRRQKRNYFYRRNTKVRFSDYNELKENENIVDQISFDAEVVSGDDFISQS